MTVKPNGLYEADALALLERIKSEEATLIYLDPPWFSRPDSSWHSIEETLFTKARDFREYLTVLSKVLQQCRRILSKSGNLFLHLDPRLNVTIHPILDQIFGSENFRSEFIWPRQRYFHSETLSHGHEIILLYSKTKAFIYNPQFRQLSENEIAQKYLHQDDFGRYALSDLTSPIARPSFQFEWEGMTPLPQRSWRYSRERLEQFKREGRIYYASEEAFPRLKIYLVEHSAVEVGSLWGDIPSIARDDTPDLRYPTQKPKALLDRIIQMGSNPGSTIIDPFCGSGTTLIAAQTANRKWLGCGSYSEAFVASTKRLERIGLYPGADFYTGDQNFLECTIPKIPFYYSPLFMPQDVATKPLIITEGKTDWKHFKAAFTKLKNTGYFEDFDIEFREYENDINMGSGELKNLCKHLCKILHFRKVICVFDRDESTIITEISDKSSVYKDWGNNVFSFAIPIPSHREETNGVCIELYYKDSEITRIDKHGRRLFLSNEFHKSGRHRSDPLLIGPRQFKNSDSHISIIENGVINKDEQNVALPKSQFADYVLNRIDNFNDFDVSEFKKTFDIIIKIAMS